MPKAPEPTRRRRNNAGIYFLTFVLCFALLGAAVLVLFVFVMPSDSGRETGASQSNVPSSLPYEPDPAHSMTVLAMGAARADSTAYSYLLLRYDAVADTIAVVPLPWQLTATVNTKTDTLAGFYESRGAGGVVSAASNATGVEIERYIRFDIDAFKTFVDIVGGVTYSLPTQLFYVNEATKYRIEFQPGEQLFDGQGMADLFRYPLYEGGEPYRLKLEAETVTALINQNMGERLIPLLGNSFTTIVNLVDTNISATDFSKREDALVRTLRDGGEPAYSIVPEGEFATDGGTFKLSAESKAEIAAAFAADEAD